MEFKKQTKLKRNKQKKTDDEMMKKTAGKCDNCLEYCVVNFHHKKAEVSYSGKWNT